MPHPKVKIADNSGNEVAVTSNALDVNIASTDAAITIDATDLSVALTTEDKVSVYGNTVVDGSGTATALLTDAQGHLQVDMLTTPYNASHAGSIVAKGPQIMVEAKLQDGGQFPNTVAEGEAVRPAASRWGVQFTSLVDDSGANTPIALDNGPYSDSNGHINIGGKYNSSAPTYADGDTAVFQTDVNGKLLISNDAIYVDDADWSDGSSKHMLVGGLYGSNTITNGDVGPIALAADGAVHIDDGGNTITVDGTVAVNTISGFATESKQPALGTAGSASANVITVQGIASMTPLVVDLGSNNDVTVTNDTAGNLLATVTQASTARSITGTVEVVQDTPADLTATVTQASSARTVTCDTAGNLLATVTQASAARTVTGTVTANAGTNLNTSALSTHAKQDTIITHLSEIEGAVETIDNAISGSEMQVDVVASLPAGSNAIGKLAANSGVDIGDVDVTSTVHPAGNGTFNSYAQFTAAESPTALTDSSNGVSDTETAAKEVIIQADFDNSGYLMVGDSGAAADTNGIRLNAGDTIILPVADIADIYIDASAASQNVNVTVIK